MLLTTGCLNNSKTPECNIVKSIGGCNEDHCGVIFTDGSYSDSVRSPAIGMRVCWSWLHEEYRYCNGSNKERANEKTTY